MSERSIFLSALDISEPAARSAYLAQACGDDAQLRQHIEELIAAEAKLGGFLNRPHADVERTDDLAPAMERPGSQIGPYKLLQQIGEGGMGIVYLAEQLRPVHRRVALKIVKPGMDSRQVIARFEAERQALAMMDHLHIAKVLDAGATSTGRPYFVMELVHGIPITRYCDENHLSPRQRLDLFVPVCQAIQHAHQKGIIHRDIKPSNVLVCLYDGQPVAKVIDFGVAKAIEQRLTERTLFTQFGNIIGTLEYMSPEQAEISQLGVDTRSDIYSLGVLLYELLTGTTPLDGKRLRNAAFDEMMRMIREEEPPKPSTRISNSQSLPGVAASRKTEPAKLARLIRGDLDWIVMKCLEKDRTRRYETANGLARDITRYLSDEPVEACPPSALYRLKKLARRNRVAFTSGALVAAALLIGLIASTALAIVASNQRDRAELATREKENARRDAEGQRDKAKRAAAAEAEQRRLAVQREAESKAARLDEAEQRKAAEAQRDKAQTLAGQLQTLTQEQRRMLYASEMNLVRIEAQRSNLAGMRELLLRQLPAADEEDLRGFEWNYWYRFLHRGQVVRRFDATTSATPLEELVLAPGGELVACTRGGQTEMIEVNTGKVLRTFPARPRSGDNPMAIDSRGQVISGLASFLRAYPPTSSFTPSRVIEAGFDLWTEEGAKRSFTYPEGSLLHVSNLAISPDGRLVAAVGLDAEHQPDAPATRLLVWHAATGDLAHNWVESREFTRLVFSDDGSRLFAFLCHGTHKNTSQLRDVMAAFDTESGMAVGVVRHDDDIDGAYCLPGGQAVLLSTLGWSGRNRMELYRWDVGDNPIRRLGTEFMPNWVKGAVSPDGALLAVGSHTVPMVRLIDTSRGVVLSTLHNEATAVNSLAFAADGSRLVAGGPSGGVVAWDLAQDEDVFHLRAEPVDTALVETSEDLAWLVYRTRSGGVRLRSRAGEETVLTLDVRPERGFNDGVPTKMVADFSRDGRLLAYLHHPDVYTSAWWLGNRVGWRLKVYDLATKQELWPGIVPAPRVGREVLSSSQRGGRLIRGRPLAFSPDGKQVTVQFNGAVQVLDLATGQFSRPSATTGDAFAPVESGLVPQSKTRRVLTVEVAQASEEESELRLIDAVSGEVLGAVGSPRTPAVTQAVAAPDARHVGVVRGSADTVEVWDLAEKRLTLAAPGAYVLFSGDGRLAAAVAVTNEIQRDQSNWSQERITSIGLWDVASGREQATVRLSGNRAEEVRFSPDGRRLITLHGKRPMSGGAVAEARLWDVTTGQELMTIPVADVNTYTWEMVFQPDSTRLTTLVLAKTAGAGGGWGASTYDAAPLGESEDALLVARPLAAEMLSRSPLQEEILAELLANPKLRPTVREAAIALVRQRADTPELVAETCLRDLLLENRPREQYEKCLRWGHAYQRRWPDDSVGDVLVGAAQFHLGQVSEAIATLSREKASASLAHHPEARRLRYFVLMRANLQAGHYEQVEDHFIDFVAQNLGAGSQSESRTESSGILGSAFSNMPIFSHPSIWFERLGRATFTRHDKNADGKLTEDEFPYPLFSRAGRSGQYDSNSDGIVIEAEYVRRYSVGLRMRMEPPQRLESINTAIRRDPTDPGPYGQRGDHWLQTANYDRAIDDYTTAIGLDPTNPQDLRSRGNTWYLKREYDNAIEDLSRALLLDPKSAETLNRRAHAHELRGQRDKALQDFDEVLRLDPQHVNSLANRGRLLRGQGKTDFALQDLDEAIRLSPSYDSAYATRGAVWRDKGDPDKALRDLNEAIRLNPRVAWYYSDRALAWWQKRNAEQALSDFAEALKLDPKLAIAYSNRGRLWLDQWDFEKARQDFHEALRLEPSSATHMNNRAAALVLLGRCTEALTDLDESIRLNPKVAAPYFWRGYAWTKQNQPDKAAADFDAYLKIFAKPADGLRDRSTRWATWREYGRAIADATALLDLDPEDTYALNTRAWLQATSPIDAERNGKQAIADATQACELSRWKNPTHLDTLAAAYAETGDFTQALQYQEQALALGLSGTDKAAGESRLALYREGRPYRSPKVVEPSTPRP